MKAVLCPICAEGAYLQSQKTAGKFGWWGPISFVYTLFSIFRNKASIRAHRKNLPWVVLEGELFPRPLLKARKDAPTRIVSGLVLFALVATPSWAWWQGRYRDFDGKVFRSFETDLHEGRVGDCVATSVSEMQDYDNGNWTVTLIPCSEPHNYQIYQVGTYQTDSTFDWEEFSKYADDYCTSDQSWANVYDDKAVNLASPNGYYYGPKDQEAYDSDDRFYCFLGDDAAKIDFTLVR